MQIVSSGRVELYTGIAQAVARISSSEGAKSLWRGMSSVVVGAGPAHAVYFGAYEWVKRYLGGKDGIHPLATATAGSCATIASDALMNPFDGKF